MNPIWSNLLMKSSRLMPDFNTYLLDEFKSEKMKGIVNYLCSLFSESIKLFDGKLKFVGCQELTPDEYVEYIKNNKVIAKKVEIQKSTFTLYRFNFKMGKDDYYIYIHVPYLDHGAVILNDTAYYPLFAIVDKGGLHITNTDVIVTVMRAKLPFRRDEQFSFTTNKGQVFREFVVTARIHQRRVSRTKKNDRPPLILYNLVKMGFHACTAYYNFKPGEIDIVPTIVESDDYSFIKISNGIYLKVKDTVLEDKFKRRWIAGYMMLLSKYPDIKSLNSLTADHAVHYKIILGKYTYPSNTNPMLLHDNAEKHLETTDVLLDSPAMYQLKSIGIEANNIYELLRVIFYNIDNWMVGYDPTDLYEKKLGSLEQIMAPLVTNINTKQFGVINNKRSEGLTPEVISKFCSRASQHMSWFASTTMFRANPTMYNDNMLLSILGKRFRSLENIELRATGNKRKRNIPVVLLKAHPSHMVVESLLALPSSSPVRTGEINPYLQIDKEGNIVKPKYADKIKHIFD